MWRQRRRRLSGTKVSRSGFTDACFSLGKCYEDGKGTRKNYRQAVRWYKAAQRGVSDDLMEHPSPMDRIEDAMVQRYMEYEAYAQSVDEVLEAQGSPWEDSFQRDLEEAEKWGWRGPESTWASVSVWTRSGAGHGTGGVLVLEIRSTGV